MNLQKNAIEISTIPLNHLQLRVAKSNPPIKNPTPLLIYNGIGANLELFFPLIERLDNIQCLIFDVPGVGGSTTPVIPMRFKGLAKLSAKLLDHFGFQQVDVLGVSWGGALAQEFARQFPARCRRLILAATSPGAIMIPGKASVLFKLSNPKRYFNERYLHTHAHTIYGGKFRQQPELIEDYATKIKAPGSKRGYYWQLAAGAGWTSIHWLHTLTQPVLILAGNDDPIIPLINAKIMNFRIPNSRLVTLECGHLFLFTMIEEVALLILEFLNQQETH
jgi:poly(3-hydroxyalkanoate) depolymerase